MLFARNAEAMLASFGGAQNDLKDGGMEYPLAIRLVGKFKTAFPEGKPKAAQPEPSPAKPEDMRAVEWVLKSAREGKTKKAAENWGVLGLLGVNEAIARCFHTSASQGVSRDAIHATRAGI